MAPACAVKRRAAFKPVFFVYSLGSVRATVDAHGGTMEPQDKEWSFNGASVCDGADPEGNVIQFRELGRYRREDPPRTR